MQEMRFWFPFSSFLSSSSFPFFMLWDPHPRGKNGTGQREKLARTTACPGRSEAGVGGSAEVAPVLAVILCVNQSLDVGALGTEV